MLEEIFFYSSVKGEQDIKTSNKQWSIQIICFILGVMVAYGFQGSDPFHLNCQISMYIVVHSIFLLFLRCLQDLYYTTVPNLIDEKKSFFFVSLFGGLSFLLIFSKELRFSFINLLYFILFLLNIDFCSYLYYLFHLLAFGLFVLFCLVS